VEVEVVENPTSRKLGEEMRVNYRKRWKQQKMIC
jgi:hypothetical protein